jgi:hypothetical protein
MELIMLEVLCGNKSMQKILIFLFVNSGCYEEQLYKSLKTPLSPLQKTLIKLEKGGLINSHYEGKTKHYKFNRAYPLIDELEVLVKKAYTLLPPHEKTKYYAPKEDPSLKMAKEEGKEKTLFAFWSKLEGLTKLTFNAKTKLKGAGGWNGQGKGSVAVKKAGKDTLITEEKGSWKDKDGNETNFTSSFRWTLNRNTGYISLEHLRHGMTHPVFLFYLAPSGKNSLSSLQSHLCGRDSYFGEIHFDPYSLSLNWRVIGPKKNEEIDYYYS